MPPNNAATRAAVECSLADLPLRTDAWVQGLNMNAEPQDHDVLLRLVEIGFLPGQRISVMARSMGGGDPLAVRVGRSTFALRRREAALVRVGAMPPAALTEPV
ncbi:FeoA family protein [Simplicispira hankyongi]|uniref:Ferrous iron transport protein A n=1 Tax=Simplicispira hankyongi TaxID=2315688 RepID=A0A398CA60_9BURK|nr:FeoA family protein [Simplicispira hankyongi]RIE00006.1 ferrous iron transport protein A [Simplicispira hankyongi]